MAYDTDNNVAVSGFSGEAVIATDYSASEGNHFQVVKLAYGNTADGGTRVTSSAGLPVAVVFARTFIAHSVKKGFHRGLLLCVLSPLCAPHPAC